MKMSTRFAALFARARRRRSSDVAYADGSRDKAGSDGRRALLLYPGGDDKPF